MPGTRTHGIAEIIPEDMMTPNGVIEFYNGLAVGDARRQRITKRANNAVHDYLRHVIAKQPREVVRRPRASAAERVQTTIQKLQEALASPGIDIVEKFEKQAALLQLQSSAQRPGTSMRALQESELDTMKKDFYLLAKFYLQHHGYQPESLMAVNVPASELSRADVI